MNRKKILATAYAILAAVFYAVSTPASKVLLRSVGPKMMAALLYLGAGIGVGILFLMKRRQIAPEELLKKEDLPYTLGMIFLDILAPIFLMLGLLHTTAANAALLNNFEIVATSLIALVIFKELISARLWVAIVLVTLSSAILSLEDLSGLRFSWGSGLVVLATLCWGLENNCTRKISEKSTYQIVMLKGIFSGLGSLVIGFLTGETLPGLVLIGTVLLLGFVAYGLSIFFYIRAQSVLGAAKTSAYYAIAPFVGAFLSFVFLREPLTASYFAALILMVMGSAVIVADTMITYHAHTHTHTVTHTHDGTTHSHQVQHTHAHSHMGREAVHGHTHVHLQVNH